MNHAHSRQIVHLPPNTLYIVSGAAALILGLLFIFGALGLTTAGLRPSLANNWLMLLFKWNAGFSGAHYSQLYGPNLLDITLMALVAVVFLGLSLMPGQTGRLWSMMAVLLPLAGIVLFVITKLAGRSGVMGAGIVISLVMLRNNVFAKATAIMGLLANALLLLGDFGTGSVSGSAWVAVCMGIGYVLLVLWFLLLAKKLLELGYGAAEEENP